MKIEIESTDTKFLCDLFDFLNEYKLEDINSTILRLFAEPYNPEELVKENATH